MDNSDARRIQPNLIGEMHERGFTLVDTISKEELLTEIQHLSSQIHRGNVDPETGAIPNGTYGLVLDWRASTDNQAACIVSVRDGFSFLRVSGEFLAECTRVLGFSRNVPEDRVQIDKYFIGNESDLLSRTFDEFGVVSDMMPMPLFESSQVLKTQVETIARLAQKSFELAMAMGIQDMFSPRNIGECYMEFPLYVPGAMVDSAVSGLPVHRHDATDETVVSVQLSNETDLFVVGSNVDSLEQVEQEQGKCIVMGPRVLHGPVPSGHTRQSVIFVATGHGRDDLHRGLEKLGSKMGWQPTNAFDRKLFNVAEQTTVPSPGIDLSI